MRKKCATNARRPTACGPCGPHLGRRRVGAGGGGRRRTAARLARQLRDRWATYALLGMAVKYECATRVQGRLLAWFARCGLTPRFFQRALFCGSRRAISLRTGPECACTAQSHPSFSHVPLCTIGSRYRFGHPYICHETTHELDRRKLITVKQAEAATLSNKTVLGWRTCAVFSSCLAVCM